MKFSAGTARKINDFVIEFNFEKDVEIDQALSIEILGIIMMLSDGKAHALLYNFNSQNIILSEIARKLSGARNYSNAQMIARAVVTQSLTSSLETTHYIKNTNPAADTRIFDGRETALQWLNEKTARHLGLNDLTKAR
jgi:hypothetical protein